MPQPAIFLDRDGTLVEEVNYLHRVEDLRLFPFTAGAVRKFKDAGYLIIIVTNQSGIGRGIYTEKEMHSIHDAIQTELNDAMDAFYFCPHLACDGCECRKPGQGMIQSAKRDWNIDVENSWMVGDKRIDVETGVNAGLRTAFVLTGYGMQHRASLEKEPTIISEHLGIAADEILTYRSRP